LPAAALALHLESMMQGTFWDELSAQMALMFDFELKLSIGGPMGSSGKGLAGKYSLAVVVVAAGPVALAGLFGAAIPAVD